MDVQHSSAIDIVLTYMDCRGDARRLWGYPSAEEYSYLATACGEVIRLIQENRDTPVLDVISEYSRKMLGYYYRKRNQYFFHRTPDCGGYYQGHSKYLKGRWL